MARGRGPALGLALALSALGTALPGTAAAGAYRDELTFLGRTTFLLREYALVVPTDLKRQPVPEGTFLEIKAWGAWNGKWVPYVYEPLTVPGVGPEDVNAIMAKYRSLRPDSGLTIRKAQDNGFLLRSEKGGSVFELAAEPAAPGLTAENPEGRLSLGLADGKLTVRGQTIPGRVVRIAVTPGPRSDPSGLYGLYDHLTLQLASGAALVVYHSRTKPGFNLVALLAPDGRGDRQSRQVEVAWRKRARDGESGRDIPTGWSVQSRELGLRADLDEWGRNLVHYKTPAGKSAVVSNAMVRGTVELDGARLDAFGLNVHVQDE
ncbi:MAG: hypothetical protein ACE147_06955 [Candidatus Methylomirabilales bacterium]